MNRHYLLSILTIYMLMACTPQAPVSTELTESQVRSPEYALQGLSKGKDLEATLFASEPLVRNPSNIDVDHRGRVWVVENVNYRPESNPDNPYQEGGDMVVILEDTDGDGKADNRKVFFQNLLVDGAMGIGVFDNQVYLSTSPHILILTDEDRDDRADKVDTLFTGMGHKQGDHTVHAVSFGPDGRLYFNYGNAVSQMLHKDGSPVYDKMGNLVKANGKPYQQGMVFRCEMDGSQLESLGYNFRNNYEVCVDSYGRMWQSDNDDDGNKSVRLNYVMEYGNYGYRDEKTGKAWQVSRTGMHPDIPARHWHQNDPGVVPNLYILGSGSPCGITLYEGDLLPTEYHTSLLHADAGPGTVRAFPVADLGAGFSATELPMLMREADAWYRPTDVSAAPDGSVFASDWYDPGVGGHWAGDASKGRIYRIAPPKSRYKVSDIDLSTPAGAAQALKSPNAATRQLAWTRLAEIGTDAESALKEMYASENPVYRARALWLLARLNAQHLDAGLKDPDPLIRATSIRVARQLYADELPETLSRMQDDSSPKVRREVAIGLHELRDAQLTAPIWARLAAQYDGQDRWYLEALGIAARGKWDACLEAWLQSTGENWNTPAGRDIIWRSRATGTFDKLLELLGQTDAAAAEQARYLRATDFLEAHDKDKRLASLINQERKDQATFQQMLLTHISPAYARRSAEVQAAVTGLLPSIQGTEAYLDIVEKLNLKSEAGSVMRMALSQPQKSIGVRAAQLATGLSGWDAIKAALYGEQQAAALSLLRSINQTESKEILKEFILDDSQEIALRKQAIEALSFDWGWEKRVIALLESGELPEELATVAATRLLSAARPVDREAGMTFLGNIQGGDTQIPSIQELTRQTGNPESGKPVFATYCQSCHQVQNEGIAFGPDLSEIANKLGKEALYSAILYPSAAISHGFEGVHIQLTDESHLMGYVLSENAQQLELKIANGTSMPIPISNIAKRESLPHSLMTPGLGVAMGETALVDLVEYLATLSNQATMVSNPYQGKLGYEQE